MLSEKSLYKRSFILRHRLWVLVILGLITLLSLWQLRNLRINNDLEIWIGRSGEEYGVYQDFIQSFGHDETIILVLRSDSLFTREMLALNHRLTDTLKNIPGVQRVVSLASVTIPILTLTGQHDIPLIPKTVTDPERVRKRVFKYQSFSDYLISADGKTTTFTLIPDSLSGVEEMLEKALHIANEWVGDKGEVVPFGIVPMKSEINRLSTSEASTFLSIAILVMIFLSWLMFRRIREALLPVAIALITIVWTLALMSLFGATLNILLSSMPLILLVVSIAFAIHFISAMVQQARAGNTGTEAVAGVLKHILRNCFFSALTTAAALGVFSLSAITPLRHFGIFAAIGVCIAFVITFTLLPVIYAKARIRLRPLRTGESMSALFPALAHFTDHHPRKIFAVSFLILLLSVLGMSRLQFNTDQETYLKKHHPVRVNNQKVGEWFEGIVPIELVYHLDDGFFDDPVKYLALFEQVETVLENTPEIRSWQSPVQLFHDFALDNKAMFRVESLDSTVLEQHHVLAHFLAKDGKTLRITAKTRWMSDNEILGLMTRIDHAMGEVFREEPVAFHFTGAMPVFALMGRRLVDSQVQSIVGAFLLILGAFLVLYRSLRWGLLCLIPNILPVAGTLGLMGFLNIPVDVVTVLISSVSFGIAIDDTIHFVSNYREALRSQTPAEAILHTYRSVGKPLVITSLLLICGFLMLVFSSYRPLIFLGTFISLNIMLALIYDFVLLPAIIHRLEISRKTR